MSPTIPDYLSFRTKEEDRFLKIAWLRQVSSDEYRSALLAIAGFIIDQGVRLWLMDSRKLAPVTFEDQQWLNQKFVPLLLGSNLVRIARVVQPDVFTYISFEQQMQKAQQVFTISAQTEQFTSEEAALGWLYMQD